MEGIKKFLVDNIDKLRDECKVNETKIKNYIELTYFLPSFLVQADVKKCQHSTDKITSILTEKLANVSIN